MDKGEEGCPSPTRQGSNDDYSMTVTPQVYLCIPAYICVCNAAYDFNKNHQKQRAILYQILPRNYSYISTLH